MDIHADRKIPIITRDEYTVSLERTSGLTLGHCDIHVPWTRDLKQKLTDDWATFLTLHRAPIFALHTPGDRKHEKFLAMFGFTFVGKLMQPDGENEIYVIRSL